jgi:predicted lactoylglutathione lyase
MGQIMKIDNVWLNLPVRDVGKSKEFFKAIGFKINPMHENAEDVTSFLIGKNNFVLMLFPNDVFRSFTQNEIADTKKGTEVLINIDAQSKEEVDEMAKTVRKAGGKIFAKPEESQGWMYAFGFEDLDGHRWSMLYMDKSKMPTTPDKS